MIESIRSKVAFQEDAVIRDNDSLETYKVVSCKEVGGLFDVKIRKITNETTRNIIEQLRDTLRDVKMSDKDFFEIDNIITSLENVLW